MKIIVACILCLFCPTGIGAAESVATTTTVVLVDSTATLVRPQKVTTVFSCQACGVPDCPQSDVAHLYWVPDPRLRQTSELWEAWLKFQDQSISQSAEYGANVVIFETFTSVKNWVNSRVEYGSKIGPLGATFVFIDPKECLQLEQWKWDNSTDLK
jgi:hypothetical protein